MNEIKNDKYWIRQQDNLEFMRELCSNSIDLIYCDYKDEKWLYHKYKIEKLNESDIANLCNVSQSTIHNWLSKYKLNKKSDKFKYKLNKEQFDLLIGNYFGDGSFSKACNNTSFSCNHANNQKNYLYWKYAVLENMCRKTPYWSNSNNINRFNTLSFDCLNYFYYLKKEKALQLLNEKSFSIWMLDDGNRTSACWTLSFQRFDNDFKKSIKDTLEKRFDIYGSLNSVGDRVILQFKAESSRKIDKIILKNIPNDLDVVQYKIINKKLSKPKNKMYITYNGEDITLYKYCKLKNKRYDSYKNKTKIDDMTIFRKQGL